MATYAEFARTMELLLAAYPRYALSRGRPVGDAKFLQDIPGDILAAAAREHIRKKAWFPHIAELRLESARLARMVIFDETQSPELIERQLFGMELALRAEFNRQAELDEQLWELLIEAYQRIGSAAWANGARARLAYYQRTLEAQGE